LTAILGLATAGWCAAASAVPIGSDFSLAPAAHADILRAADKSDAWYASSPLSNICLGALSCISIPLPPPTYPTGTLHVGVTLGKETARSYVTLSLGIPAASLAGATGTLVLPVAHAVTDRTIDPASASILACLAAGRVRPAAGATSTPPAVDCSASVHARYDPKLARFTVNLRPFLRDWAQGVPNYGIALLPDLGSAKLTTLWQVSFDGKGASEGPKVSALLALHSASVTAPTTPSPTPATPLGSPSPPTVAVPTVVPPPAAVTGPGTPAPAPEVAGPAPQATDAGLVSRVYLNSAVFLVPLALLASAVFFSRLFTADPITGRRKRS
jgi:hypothetical protein